MKVCLFGDSVAKGIVADAVSGKYKVLKENFAQLCADKLNIVVENFGRFGNTTVRGEKSLFQHAADIRQSAYVLFCFGGNDCDFDWNDVAENPMKPHAPHCPLEAFVKRYAAFVDTIKRLHIKPVLLSLPPIDSERFFKNIVTKLHDKTKVTNILEWMHGDINLISRWHDSYNLAIFRLGKEAGIPVIDITTPFLARSDYRDYICEDGIHPNEKGHALIAEAIEKAVEPVLIKNC